MSDTRGRPSADFAVAMPSAEEMPPHMTRQCPLAATPSINAAPSVSPPVITALSTRRSNRQMSRQLAQRQMDSDRRPKAEPVPASPDHRIARGRPPKTARRQRLQGSGSTEE